jgi:hypothetical protein
MSGPDDPPFSSPPYQNSGGLRQDEAGAAGEQTQEEVKAFEVQGVPARWLWLERIPPGKLTLLDGDPGLGKSLLTLDPVTTPEGGQEP